MSLLDPNLVETLLHMSESDMLDFKRDQYPLAGASDDEKSELVKDVLAFANAWKTDDAYIVIGADENPGGRAVVVGVSGHLNDAHLQQLVNLKTNVPVDFEYLAVTVDGLPIGIIRIKKTQQRPVFLLHAFGRLRQNAVYLRRGSSTAVADPAEIARMGADSSSVTQAPQVSLELADPHERRVYGTSIQITSRVLEAPLPAPLPEECARNAARHRGRVLGEPRFAWNRPDAKKLIPYRQEVGLLVRRGFCVRNIGKILAEDVRVLVEIPKYDALRVIDELPERPRGPLAPAEIVGLHATHWGPTVVGDGGAHWEIVARLGKIQPDARVWSSPFWVGSPIPRDMALMARVFGDNIATPIDVPLKISIQVEEGWLEDEGEDDG